MIITRIIGGLGNQMFQYAVGRAISVRNGVQLKLDLSGFDGYALRQYRLNVFNVDEEIASLVDIKQLKPNKKDFRKWLPYYFKQKLYPFHCKPFINERFYHFDPAILDVKGNAYLSGYWQSEQYFKDVEGIIRSDFVLKDELGAINKKLKEEIDNSNSVSMHIRRGDYLTNPETNKTHGLLPLDYYYTAIERIEKIISNPVYYIFSDDFPWVEKNLKIFSHANYITHNGVSADYCDLELMRTCKHHIIANSSFSWWGAWLCPNNEKIVIAPKKWFARQDINTVYRLPNNWIEI